jgi:outer membrane protein assembly factor BamB
MMRYIPIFLAAMAILAVGLWLQADPLRDMSRRDEVAGTRPITSSATKFPGEFLAMPGPEAPNDISGSWPMFRGEAHDGISPDETPLAHEWPAGGPPKRWTVNLGLGYAGAAILNSRVYVLDYDEAKQADTLRCFSLVDGRELWRRGYEIPVDSDHGMSRTVPAVTDRSVVTLGPKLHVMCVETSTGSFRWGLDMVKEYKTTWPKWYAGQCPLVDRDRLILAPAGPDVLMTALELDTGKPVWTTPNPNRWRMTHSSIVPMDFKGYRMYLYCASGGITAVAGEDVADWKVKAGDILWERADWKVPFANVPTPVILGGSHILLSGGYGGGAMLLKLKEEGGKFSTDVVWRFKKSKEFGAEQQTPIFYKGYIYAVLPKDAGTLAEQLVCIDSTGKHVWESGRDSAFGLGPYLIADGLIFVMDEKGLLTMVEATSEGYKPLAKAQVIEDAKEAWTPMAFAGGYLIVRDVTRMVCLDLNKK